MNTRDKIIKTTIDLLLEKGFHGTRINEVLKRSKISKGSLYYYFPEGKEQLCKECLKLFTIKLSLEYKKLFTNAANLEDGLYRIITYTKHKIEQSEYATGSLLINVSQEIDSDNKEIQKLCKELFELIITTIESFFFQYNIQTWKQSARSFVLKLNGAIILSKACKTSVFLNDLIEEYSA
ncbi:MAG: hypothetical protein CMP63_05035 [Flavobacteriales bacterium]|nr:hypothetical protein [Flavobacteriales bacterium]|tara:strand:+ start:1067 stop:1606 length:540 start_codon:yes stop_codon:yes gene_type:complete